MKFLYFIILFGVCSLVLADQKKPECDCHAFIVNDMVNQVCPGSTFQFEQRGWHGSCESRGTDPNTGQCKCYNCSSCSLLDTPGL